MKQNLARRQPQPWRQFDILRRAIIPTAACHVGVGLVAWTLGPVRSRVSAGERSVRSTNRIASINVDSAVRATPEFRLIAQYDRDSDEYYILSRKAQLRVTAAFQHVARELGYSSILLSPSSVVPHITDRVIATIVSPTDDFTAVASISDDTFAGGIIPAIN